LCGCACNDAKRNKKTREGSKEKTGNYQVKSQYERSA
jgi:hypothetical protein